MWTLFLLGCKSLILAPMFYSEAKVCSLVYSTTTSSQTGMPNLSKSSQRGSSETQPCHRRGDICLEYSKVSKYIHAMISQYLHVKRPSVLQLVKQRINVAQATPKKRKRSPEQTSSVERVFESVAGPSNSRSPCLPTKPPKSPSKKLRASSDSEDVVEIAVPSSDIDEDEVTTNPARLNPQGIPFFQILLSVDE